jgi:hypothetical protein
VEGQKSDQVAPGDPTGAAGPKSYIQFINDQMAIYTRAGGLISAVGPGTFTSTGGADTNYSDPQILWDRATNRFYYLIIHTTDDTFAWGFSKSSNPKNPTTDFCHYNADFGYGSDLPDYPKMGDTKNFLLIGANIYQVEAYLGSDVDWLAKPTGIGTISSCPAATSIKKGRVGPIMNSDGSTFASDPNPAQQADPSTTGWIAAVPDETNSGAAGNFLTIFKVTKNRDGSANIPTTGTQVSVNQFGPPPPAPQSGSNFTIDTLDGRLTHAVSAIDPGQGGLALWTGHSVAGGAGAQYQWYEIDVVGAKVFQQGDVADPSLFVYNGAVAPDRLDGKVGGHSYKQFGSNAVIGFTTSSAQASPAVQMVSKLGTAAISAFVMVKQGAIDSGFDCTQNPFVPDRCRWGDYGGAAPDPAANPNTNAGRVWLTNMFANGTTTPNEFAPTWATQIWQATP